MPIKHRLKSTKDMTAVKARKKPKTVEQKAKNKKALKYAKLHKRQITQNRKKREAHKTSADKNFDKKHKAEIAKTKHGSVKKVTKVVTTTTKVGKSPEARKLERIRLRNAKLKARETQRKIAKAKVAKLKKIHQSKVAKLEQAHKARVGSIRAKSKSRLGGVTKSRKPKKSLIQNGIAKVKKAAKKIIKKIKNGTHHTVRHA